MVNHPTDEARIVFVLPAEQLPDYAREYCAITGHRTGTPGIINLPHDCRLVAYAELLAGTPGDRGFFSRRTWITLPRDRDQDLDGPFQARCPANSCDPRKIRANCRSRHSSRSVNGFRPKQTTTTTGGEAMSTRTPPTAAEISELKTAIQEAEARRIARMREQAQNTARKRDDSTSTGTHPTVV